MCFKMSRYSKLYHTVRVSGSKLNHLEKIYKYFPPLDSWKHFIDPMAGSLCVPLNLPVFGNIPFKDKKIISINDVDGGLIDLALCQLFYPERVEKAINNALKHQGLFKILKYKPENFEKDVWLNGMRKYYLLQYSFSSKADGTIGYSTNVYRGRHPNHPVSFYKEISRRLKYFQIFNEDFRVFLRRFSTTVKNGFMYADPPYFVAEDVGYYTNFFREKDHIDFAEIVHEMNDNGFKICISYDDNPKVYKLYKDYRIYKVKFRYSLPSNGRPEKNELIITNYKPNVKKQGSLDKWI